jgi:rhodanese-related sulfurtransferase
VDSISVETLCEKLERGDDLVLVDARSPMAFGRSHLPGAVNLPLIWVDEQARSRIPDGDAEIVVYCEGVGCDSSTQVAARLRQLGYANVRHYEDGHRGWLEAGLEVDDGAR